MFKKAGGVFAAFALATPFFVSAQSTCPPLSLGSTGARVTAVQTVLQSAYTNFPTPTGYFGPLTQAALKQWQEEHGIEPVGTVGPKTAAAMKLSCTATTTVTVPSTPSVGSISSPQTISGQDRTLSRGMSGNDVAALQQFLISQKLLPADSVTGFFGVLTEAAVKAFQSQNSVVSSGAPSTTGYGAVGPKTRGMMALMYTQSGGTEPQTTTTTAYLIPATTAYVPPAIPTVPSKPVPAIIPPTRSSCTLNNQTISDGSSVTAYQSSSVASGQNCISETRICTNGTLSGSYTAPACVAASTASCSFNGQSVASGAAVTAYQAASVASGSQCISQIRVCTNGALSGSYTHANCSVAGAAAPSCTISYTPSTVTSGQPYVIDWTSQNATSRLYSVKKPDGTYLVQNGGVAIGTGTYTDATASSQLAAGTYTRTDTVTGAGGTATCTATIAIAASPSTNPCTFNGQTVAHGTSVTAYQASSVAYGNQCVSQVRTCANGTLSGSYTNAACTVAAAPQSAIVVQTSSSATGYPASNMLDGSLSTAWVASLQPVGVNNFAWIQLDVGSRRYIDTIEWTSASQPYPASVLKHYVIKVSDDGVGWTPVVVRFEPHTAAPAYVQRNSIGKNARYIRIETTKINDASGWAASIAELSVASEPQRDLSYACDVTITPSEDYGTRIGSLRGGTAERWVNVCLQPGTYAAGTVRIHDAQYLRMLAPSGGVTFTASVMASTPVGGNTAPFNIWDSHDIHIQNIKTVNTYRYTTTSDSTTQWSHALKMIRSNTITLENVAVVSNGKQAVYLENSNNILINGGSINGYYFLLSPANQNSIYAYNVSFTSDGSAQIPADEHSMFWVDAGDVVFDSSYFNMITGKGLFTGGGGTHSRLVITGATRASGLSHWADNHQNYSSMHVYVTGTYPALTPFYNYDSGGNAADSFVCTYSGAAAPLTATGCAYPLR